MIVSPQSQISVSGQPASLTGNDLLIFEMSSALSSGRTERECVHQHILSSHFNQSSLRLKECPLSKASMPHVITFFLAWLIITSDFSRFWFFFFFYPSRRKLFVSVFPIRFSAMKSIRINLHGTKCSNIKPCDVTTFDPAALICRLATVLERESWTSREMTLLSTYISYRGTPWAGMGQSWVKVTLTWLNHHFKYFDWTYVRFFAPKINIGLDPGQPSQLELNLIFL